MRLTTEHYRGTRRLLSSKVGTVKTVKARFEVGTVKTVKARFEIGTVKTVKARFWPSGLGNHLGGVPREQKMPKRHLPRVIYHQVY